MPKIVTDDAFTVVRPKGESFHNLTADWWKWVMEAPDSTNPLFDTTGEWANVNNDGPVFFLAGTLDPSAPDVVRPHITVPEGKPVLVPIQNYFSFEGAGYETPIDPYPGSPSNPNYNAATNKVLSEFFRPVDKGALEFSINGHEIPNLQSYYVNSGNFTMTAEENSLLTEFFGIPEGTEMINNKSFGYYVLLDNLISGQTYTLHFGNVTDTLTIA